MPTRSAQRFLRAGPRGTRRGGTSRPRGRRGRAASPRGQRSRAFVLAAQQARVWPTSRRAAAAVGGSTSAGDVRGTVSVRRRRNSDMPSESRRRRHEGIAPRLRPTSRRAPAGRAGASARRAAGRERDRRALHEHRREDDDEDELVDPPRVVDAGLERERGEQDRHRALQPAPGDEGALAAPQARRQQQRPDDERADRRTRARAASSRPSRPAGRRRATRSRSSARARRRRRSRRATRARRGRSRLSALNGDADVADEQAGDEDGEEARAVRDGGDAVDDPGRRRACAACRGRRSAARRAASPRASSEPAGDRRRRARSPSASANSRTTIQALPSGVLASSIIPIISAIPTGSFAPDSPCRIVPVRPPISRSPSTENITAGSVGATAAPSRPAGVQPRPSTQCATSARRPRSRTCRRRRARRSARRESRKRRQPIERPPSKRITISATRRDPHRRSRSRPRADGKMSDAMAAATRNGAAAGIENRSLSFVVSSATARPAATSRIAAAEGRDVVHRGDRTRTAEPAPQALTNSLLFRYSRHTSPRKYSFSRCGASCLDPARDVLSPLLSRRSPRTGRAGDGSLVVSNASGTITVQGKGLIFGHFDRGSADGRSTTSRTTRTPRSRSAARKMQV